jgi:hypothetical protein
MRRLLPHLPAGGHEAALALRSYALGFAEGPSKAGQRSFEVALLAFAFSRIHVVTPSDKAVTVF